MDLENILQKFPAACGVNILHTEVHNRVIQGTKLSDLENKKKDRNRYNRTCLFTGLFFGISPSNTISERTCAVFTLDIPFLPHPYEISLQGKDYHILKYPKITISDG